VKRITEQAQLRLSSLDRRAVLHTEFAERRLREAAELRSSGSSSQGQLLLAKSAMADYASELSQASADLKQLKNSVGSSQALAVVSDVQSNIDSLKNAIEENGAVNTSSDAGAETLEARQAVKETQEAATTVVVDVHEEEATEKSSQELKTLFTKELGSIEGRQTFDEHRLDVISKVITANEGLSEIEGIPSGDDLKRMGFVIRQTRLQIPEAMNGFAAGGYRTAFTTLQGIDSELLKLESDIAGIESLITSSLEAQREAAAAAAAETPPTDAPTDTPVTPETETPSVPAL
jgi:hypothetical protein